MEAADAGVECYSRYALVRRSGAGADARPTDRLGLAETLGRQTHHEAAYAALAHQQV